jgi:hypothetical protein
MNITRAWTNVVFLGIVVNFIYLILMGKRAPFYIVSLCWNFQEYNPALNEDLLYLAKCQPLHAFLYFMVSLCFFRKMQSFTLHISLQCWHWIMSFKDVTLCRRISDSPLFLRVMQSKNILHLKVQALCCFEMSGTCHPATHCHLTEDLNRLELTQLIGLLSRRCTEWNHEVVMTYSNSIEYECTQMIILKYV